MRNGRYSFSATSPEPAVIGTPSKFRLHAQIIASLEIERVAVNAPCESFFRIDSIQIGNQKVETNIDGYDITQNSPGKNVEDLIRSMKLPRIHPDESVVVYGEYSGAAPAPFFNGQRLPIIVRFTGPSFKVPS